MSKPGRLRKLASRAAREARQIYGERRGIALQWIEIKMELGVEDIRRTLMTVGPEGQLGAQTPSLPQTHVPARLSSNP